MLKTSVIFFLMLMVVSFSAQPCMASTADTDVASGRALFFNHGSPQYDKMVQSYAKFQSALAASPGHQEALFWHAITRFVVFALQNGSNAGEMDSLKEFIESLGFPRLAGQAPPKFPYDIPLDAKHLNLPQDAAGFSDFQGILTGDLVSVIEGALSDLAPLGVTFQLYISSAELGSDAGVEVDYGDVLMLRAVLLAAKAGFQALSAYNMDANLKELSVISNAGIFEIQKDILDGHPDLLKLLPAGNVPGNGAARMAGARQTALAAVDAYMAASDAIRNENDPQDDDLITMDPDSLEDETHFRESLTEAKQSILDGRVALITNKKGDHTEHVDFNRIFGTPAMLPLSLRTVLPEFGDDLNIISGSFPDATLGGVLPDLPTEEQLAGNLGLSVLYPISTATMVMDGNEADWAVVPPIGKESMEWNSASWEGHVFLDYFKVAQDANYLYIMAKLAQNPDPAYKYTYSFYLNGSSFTNVEIWPEAEQWGLPVYSINGYGYEYTGTDADWEIQGRVIEARIPNAYFRAKGNLGANINAYWSDSEGWYWGYGYAGANPVYRTPMTEAHGSVACGACGAGPVFVRAYTDGPNLDAHNLVRGCLRKPDGSYSLSGLLKGVPMWIEARQMAGGNGINGPGDLVGNSSSFVLSQDSTQLRPISMDKVAHFGFSAWAGTNQKACPGCELLYPLEVRVVDDYGAAVEAWRVDFSPDSEDAGAVQPTTALTDEDGIARSVWTAGEKTGNYTVTAHASGMEQTVPFQALVTNALMIYMPGLPDSFESVPYLVQMRAVGGTPPYTWGMTPSPSFPGFSMDFAGNLSGTGPTPADFTSSLQISVMDQFGLRSTETFPLTAHATVMVTGQVGTWLPGHYTYVSGADVWADGIPQVFKTDDEGNFTLYALPGDRIFHATMPGFGTATEYNWVDSGWPQYVSIELKASTPACPSCEACPDCPVYPDTPCSWDLDQDGKISMQEILYYLQTLANVRPQP